jgi:gliding motility-associated lipoprotein GldD
MNFKLSYFLVVIFIFNSCESVDLPKPNAYLRLDFPSPDYKQIKFGSNNVSLEINTSGTSITETKNSLISKIVAYPLISAEMSLEYYNLNIDNKLNNTLESLSDFTAIHLKKSLKPPKIQEFVNENEKLYASIINIKGDVTSPYQFYATDSTSHLIIGILNLKSKTKHDSVLPALNYLKNDVYHLIESIKWSKNK